MASTKDVDIGMLSQVVQSVQQVVSSFYGPQCQQTMLTSQTGQAVITSDGLTILDSLQPSHPVAMLITTAVRNCLRHTQDGCKIFLLYLSAILKGLQSHINNGSFCHNGTAMTADKRILNQQGAITVVRCLHRLNQDVMPGLFEKMSSHSSQLYTKLRQIKSDVDILQDVCKTTLAAHYNPNLCDYFSGIIVKFFALGRNQLIHGNIQKCLRFSLDHYGLLCIKVSNRSYTECTVLPPLLIRRDFAVKIDHILVKKSVKTLMLNITVEDDDDRPVSFSVKDESYIADLIHQKRRDAEDFGCRCAAKGVDLVICSDTVPGFILDKFRQKNISVIASVLKEDIELMEQLTGKFSVNWYDEIDEKQNLVETAGVQKLGLGGQVYLHVKIKPLVTVNQLVVCAPTIGLCDQAAMAIQKALTSMLMCFSGETEEECPTLAKGSEETNCCNVNQFNYSKFTSNYTNKTLDEVESEDFKRPPCPYDLMVIEGGGGFELLLSKLVSQYGKNCGDQNLSIVCEVLTDSLIHALKVLYENTALSESCRGFLELKQALQNKLYEGSLWGLNQRGQLCDVKEKGVLESVGSKLHVFSCVLRLIEQLLKADKIVSVKKLGS